MAGGDIEIVELLDSDDDDVIINNNDGEVQEVQVARAVRNAAPAGADDDDDDIVVTGAWKQGTPRDLFLGPPLLLSSKGICRSSRARMHVYTRAALRHACTGGSRRRLWFSGIGVARRSCGRDAFSFCGKGCQVTFSWEPL
jgi:hypothetical protein